MRKFYWLVLTGLLITGTQGFCQQSDDPLVSLDVTGQSLRQVLTALQLQTGLNILASEKLMEGIPPITLHISNMPLSKALETCLQNTHLSFRTVKGTIVIQKKSAPPMSSANAPRLASGRVVDRDRHPMVGVTIHAQKALSTSLTDDNGRFVILAETNDLLAFSHVNYRQEVFTLRGRRENIDIIMQLLEDSMAEVVISTGYQKITQKNLTGSVTTLKMDSIYQPGLTTVDKMLEGRVPGMIYLQNSGQPGAAPKLRIRGTSTLLGTQEPLWVIDGIAQTDPVPVAASSINDLDFVNLVGNAISGLNPSDIDQIDVLKDAAATALYGVRAANGVIVVTTKRGRQGPPTVNYSISGNLARRPRYTDHGVSMMNSAERVDVSRQIIQNQLGTLSGDLYEGYEKAIIDYYQGNIDAETYHRKISRAETMNTDWFDILTRDVFSTNHSLSLSGGTALSRYYASVGYTNEQGVIKGESNQRHTAQLKYDINYKNFKAQFDISVNQGKRQYVPEAIGVMNYAYGTSRAIPLTNEDGSLYFYTGKDFYSSNSYEPKKFNIVNEINHSSNQMNEGTYRATANFNYQVFQGLQLEAVLSYTGGSTTQDTWFDASTQWVSSRRGPNVPAADGTPDPMDPIPYGGELNEQITRKKSYTIRGQLNYSKYLDRGQLHALNILLGSETSSTSFDDVAQRRRGYYPDRGNSLAVIDPFTYIAYSVWANNLYENQGGMAKITNSLTNLASGYLTSSYSYRDRYSFSVSTRSDFSNSFGNRSNERLLPTWSLGARWNLQNDILKNTLWIDQAAIRLSFGKQGNMLPNQTPYTIIQRGGLNSLYNSFTASLIAFPNPYLKWEQTQSYNAGLDFALFHSKISGSIGFFYKKTQDAFLSKRVSQINGISTFIVNSGVLQNKGIEIQLNFVPINRVTTDHSTRRGFIWRIDPQLSQVLNKVLSRAIDPGQTGVYDPSLLSSPDVLLNGSVPINGQPVSTFYSFAFKGIDSKGIPVFYGLEPEQQAALMAKYRGMPAQDVFTAILRPSGRREPVIQGGISNYFGYNNWSLDFMFTYSLGNKVRLLKIASGNYGVIRPSMQQNMRKELVNRWRQAGDEHYTNIPGILAPPADLNAWWQPYPELSSLGSYYQAYDYADLRVVNGDYLKLQSVNLRYNIPASIAERWHAKAASIGVGGSNLFTLASSRLRGQDPSQSGSSSNIGLSIRPVYNFFINLSL